MSSLYTLQEVLDPHFLSRAYTKRASATMPNNPFMTFYTSGKPDEYDGDVIEMAVFSDDREAAPINAKGAPARTLDTRGAEKKYFTPIHAFNEVTIPTASVEHLRNVADPGVQDRGMQELRRQMDLFGRRHRLLRLVTLSKAFSDGIIYYDGNGKILESSSGAHVTVDLGVPASHKTQLNHTSAGTNIINTAWDQAGASILGDLQQIVTAAEHDMTVTPSHVWLHGEAKTWIINNTEIKEFVKYNMPTAKEHLDTLANNAEKNTLQLGSWTFHFYSGTYVGADGSTIRPLIPKTKAIITPAPGDGDWFRHYETSELVPSKDGLFASLESAMGSFDKVYGDFAYLRVNDNPPSVSMRMGCNFLYAFADPNAVWMPTVDF